MPAGSAVATLEAELRRRYPGNKHAIFGTLNKLGLMHGNKATKKGLKRAKKGGKHAVAPANSQMNALGAA